MQDLGEKRHVFLFEGGGAGQHEAQQSMTLASTSSMHRHFFPTHHGLKRTGAQSWLEAGASFGPQINGHFLRIGITATRAEKKNSYVIGLWRSGNPQCSIGICRARCILVELILDYVQNHCTRLDMLNASQKGCVSNIPGKKNEGIKSDH